MNARLLKATAMLIALCWMAALASPARNFAYGYRPNPRVETVAGWTLAIFGWLGPLAASFAWYANILLFVTVFRLAKGQQPGTRLPFVALVLASTVFLPAFSFDFVLDGRFHPVLIAGPAVWLWIGAFTIAAAPSVLFRLIKTPKSDEDTSATKG